MFGGQGSRADAAHCETASRRPADPDVRPQRGLGRQAPTCARRSAPRGGGIHGGSAATTCELGDFFIGKPGPGCLSEAVHMGLPVITFQNAWTMPQERFNTRWVREQGLGLVVPALSALPAAVQTLIDTLGSFQHRVRVDRQPRGLRAAGDPGRGDASGPLSGRSARHTRTPCRACPGQHHGLSAWRLTADRSLGAAGARARAVAAQRRRDGAGFRSEAVTTSTGSSASPCATRAGARCASGTASALRSTISRRPS